MGNGAKRLELRHVACLQFAVLTSGNLKRNSLTLIKRPETIHLDLREVDKQVLSILAGDKSVTLFGVKPLNGTFSHYDPLFLPHSVGTVLITARTQFHPINILD